MAEFVWVGLDGDSLREVAVDLHQCVRECLECYNPSLGTSDLTIYRTGNGAWILETVVVIPQIGPPHDSVYWFLDPIEAARMYHERGRRIPLELAEHRSLVSNDAEYEAWYYGRKGWVKDEFGIYNPPPRGAEDPSPPTHPPRPSWDRGSRTLTFAGRTYRPFDREAENQMALLDAFQQKGWLSELSRNAVGLTGEERQRQTVKDFNKKAFVKRLPIVLGMGAAKFTWRTNPDSDLPQLP